MKLRPTAHPHPQPAHEDWEVLLHPVEGSLTPRGTDREDDTAGFDEIEADRRSERRLIEQTLLALLAVAALIAVGLLAM